MKSPETNVIFIRHGENEKDPEKTSKEQGLTEKGITEAKGIGEEIAVDTESAAGFHTDNRRSMLATLLSIYPDIDKDDLEKLTDEAIKNKRIRPYYKLSYDASDDSEFSKALCEAGIEKKVLRFLVENSDDFRKKSYHEITSYSIAASDVAKIILKYDKIHTHRIKKENNLVDQNLQRVFCAREFIFPCFRAKITSMIKGEEEKDRYLDWYELNIEDKESARSEISVVKIVSSLDQDGVNRFTLSDSFGEIEFEQEELDKMLEETELSFEKIRVGAYIIPFNKRGEVGLLKYPDGYGFIGGGVERGESLKKALERELDEELETKIDTAKLDMVTEPYSFIMKKNKRPGVPEHKENHFFFVTEFRGENNTLVFKESKAHVVWLNSSELLNPEVIKFSDLREFLSTNILPKLTPNTPNERH